MLSSGQKSSFYIDLKSTTLSAKGAFLIGKLAVEMLDQEGLLERVEGVGGLTLGADPIATAVSIESYVRSDESGGLPAFIVRKEVKGHGTIRDIEGLGNLRDGASVLIVEDVSTTGGSAMIAVEKVRQAGLHVLGILSVVDREQGAQEFFASKSIPFFSLIKLSEIKSRYRA